MKGMGSLARGHIPQYLRVEQLTPRELDVLRLVAQAARTQEIAGHLGISPRTVECHLGHVYGKLGIRGRLEAMLWTMGESRLDLHGYGDEYP
jgi:DNA-binding CsgD family transcriptional regulator